MAQKTNSFERFWKELKRRKVFGVVTTYAATAYIIIEVVNNLIGPLHLPDWLATLVVILLITGLPLAVVMAWIFDFTPQGIKKTESIEESERKEIITKPVKRKLRASYVLNAILIIAVIVLAYPKIFKRDILEKLRSSGEKISVAVMPFQNMTNDTTWNIWQDGIQDILINSLSNSEELKVRQAEYIKKLVESQGIVNYFSITPSVASTISQKLDANVLIFGNMKQAGNTIRLYTQLINSETEEVFKSFQIEGLYKEENIFHLIDSLSIMVKNFLILSKLEKESPFYLQDFPSTTSPEAFRYYLYGEKARNNRDYPSARNMFLNALAIDSNFTLATLMLSVACTNQGDYAEARKWSILAYEKRDQMPIKQRILTNKNHAFFFETPYEELKYLRQYQEIDDQNPDTYYSMGFKYFDLLQYDKAIPEFEKSLEIYNKLAMKPRWIFNYSLLGWAYYHTGQNKKVEKLLRKADKDFPNDALITHIRVVLALKEEDTIAANKYIEQYKSIRKENSWPDASIAYNLGTIYHEVGNLEKAEEYHRLALSLEPDNGFRMYDLGYFLIYTTRNIKEGLELVDKSIGLLPDFQWYFLEGKGLGLYKQGKYKEALELLEKCRDLSLYYRHSVYLSIDSAKKAFALH